MKKRTCEQILWDNCTLRRVDYIDEAWKCFTSLYSSTHKDRKANKKAYREAVVKAFPILQACEIIDFYRLS